MCDAFMRIVNGKIDFERIQAEFNLKEKNIEKKRRQKCNEEKKSALINQK